MKTQKWIFFLIALCFFTANVVLASDARAADENTQTQQGLSPFQHQMI